MDRFRASLLAIAVIAGLSACGSSPGPSAPTYGGATSACGADSTTAGSDSGPEVNPPGDIPDNQAFIAYSPADGTYSVKVPEGWARTESSDGTHFTDKLNAIDVRVRDAVAPPTVESVKADEVPALSASTPCFRLADVKTVTRKAGTAVLITYSADSASDPVTGKVLTDDVERYQLWHGGKSAVLTLSGPAGADNVDPWRIVTDSFTWR